MLFMRIQTIILRGFRMKRIVFVIGMGLCCGYLQAQEVKGTIADAVSRKPLGGARITYKNETAAITDSTGHFSFTNTIDPALSNLFFAIQLP